MCKQETRHEKENKRKKKQARKFGLGEMKINEQRGIKNTECINTTKTNTSCSVNREQSSIS
jgi:hypothetical protein